MNKGWWHYSDADAVLVFVHGVLSDNEAAWSYKDKRNPENNRYWPTLIQSDKRFKNIAIYLSGYHTDVDAGRLIPLSQVHQHLALAGEF